LNIDGLKKARRTIMEYRSFPEISQWLYEAGTEHGVVAYNSRGSKFWCPLIEANEQFERSVQVVDRDQLYDPPIFRRLTRDRNGVDMKW
jgi:hypothetical protein